MVRKIKIDVFANEKHLIFSYLTRFSFAGSFAEITTLAHTNRGFRLLYFLLKNRFANGILLILRDWRHIRLQDRLRKQPLSSSTYLQVQAVSFAVFKDYPVCILVKSTIIQSILTNIHPAPTN